MRIHHLNCGCMCPIGGALFDGRSSGPTACLVCHCLLIETDDGLVLVDTGFGVDDVRRPDRLSGLFRTMNNIKLDRRYTALGEVERLGFSAADVRHIVLTHLDFDHAGGLSDFPHARVHVMADELQSAEHAQGFVGKRRYRPDQWASTTEWRTYRADGETWMGFPAVRDLQGLPADILFIPLAGHTAGHAGVAVRTDGRWLLHAGDAYFFHGEVHGSERTCPPGMRAYQDMMNVDKDARLANQVRLRALANDPSAEVTVFCSHDAGELHILGGQPAEESVLARH
ncbi:MBL fold metallo-hydrolase [Chthonobacter rhizosphaerae]|uniref:MBL fold metallo-hydrolase n=1 Tax=Chthonobacter rhizosphaerae TaxID=2735553 RepID=UPI0015EED43F|nr:MBL fold metallo-hydrolase [Chthonobacter rhizosphaerae]